MYMILTKKQEDKDILMAGYSPVSASVRKHDAELLSSNQGEAAKSFRHPGISWFSIDNNPQNAE
jgi:hypothetical protein